MKHSKELTKMSRTHLWGMYIVLRGLNYKDSFETYCNLMLMM
jgi:hypothetical protein